MITLDEPQATVQAGAGAGLPPLGPGQLRRGALWCIPHGPTAHDLRVLAVRGCPEFTPLWLAYADEVEDLTRRGLTPQRAVRALVKLGRAYSSYRKPEAREPERAVAEALLRQEGPGAVSLCVGIAAGGGDTGGSFLKYAAEAALLLAGRAACRETADGLTGSTR